MDSTDRRYRLLRRVALCCALAVLAVTSLSAYMRLSKAGLGCEDWPQCYGQSHREQPGAQAPQEPAATGAARLAHRVMAVAALALIVFMLVLCFGSAPALRREGLLALALLALALGLAVLGRWSSAARVPAVAMGNLLGGFAMLALSVRLMVSRPVMAWPRLGGWALCGVVLLLVQIALGGLVSASFAGLSCSADDACRLWPALQRSGWEVLNPWREPVLAAAPPFNADGVAAQSLHRIAAWAVALALLPLAWLAWRSGRQRSALWLLGLLACQLLTGLLMVGFDLPLALALLHNLLASLVLAVLVLLV